MSAALDRRRLLVAALAAPIGTASAAPVTPIRAIAFSPDSKDVLWPVPGAIEVHPVAGGPPRRLPCRLPQVRRLQFTPDGQLLLAAGGLPGVSAGLAVYAWPGASASYPPIVGSDRIEALACDFVGERAAIGVANEVRVYRLTPAGPAELLRRLTTHTAPVSGVAWSPDGSLLLSAGLDRTLRVWDGVGYGLLRTLTNHTDAVNDLACDPDRKAVITCATGADDGTFRLWQPGIGRMVRIDRVDAGAVLSVAFSPDGRRLFVGSVDGEVHGLDRDQAERLPERRFGRGWIPALAVSPDGTMLACGSTDGFAGLWSLQAAPGPATRLRSLYSAMPL